MLEWLKRHAWKACKLQKGFGGSNPPLSAKDFYKRTSPSLLERMSFRKDLNKVPAAACWDYEEIPLSVLVQACLREGERKRIAQDARGRLWGLRRNPPLSEDAVGRLGHSRWASAARSVSSNPIYPVADCGDYAEIIVRGNAEISNPPLFGRAQRGRCPRIHSQTFT